jgi:hypothetical protein
MAKGTEVRNEAGYIVGISTAASGTTQACGHLVAEQQQPAAGKAAPGLCFSFPVS